MFHTCGFWSFSFINAASTPLKNRSLITKKEVQYLTKKILGRYGTLKSRKKLNKPLGYKKTMPIEVFDMNLSTSI